MGYMDIVRLLFACSVPEFMNRSHLISDGQEQVGILEPGKYDSPLAGSWIDCGIKRGTLRFLNNKVTKDEFQPYMYHSNHSKPRAISYRYSS